MARTRVYRGGVLMTEDIPAEDISEHLLHPEATVWLDMCAPDADDLETVRDELGLHQLAIEDAVHVHQRAKIDRYSTHSFVTTYLVRFDPATGMLTTSEVSMFVTAQALVTIRADEHLDMAEVVERWDSSDMGESGVGYLLHGVLDYVVDGYFEAVRELDEQIEALEDLIFMENVDPADVQRRSLHLRKSLVVLRRVVLPMREVVNTLMRRDLHYVDEELLPYYHDVYDHILRASEWTESLRDLVATIRETQLNLQGNRLNTIMKQVTSWAAIIAVPTAITGFYGQNIPFPGFDHPFGFWLSSALIVVLAVVLFRLFKRRDWL
ncbi:magnesium transporter CorA family protein [Saccharothrix sp. NPDC042600]|uniref:magnesium transporter CorA family protein n=1 Tax=Saccharothrix TaxID=2071 RepID=UPI0034027273|nr:magnesium transporter CorA family protein [Saccharothrix mutabilis subsp. capreolus]